MSAPETQLAELESRARRIETPCGQGSMVWRIWGSGPPLVLGHGGQGAWSHWIRNIDVLAAHYTVIAADLPGHGDSAMPEVVDHDTISAVLARGIREIIGEGQRATFVGFSFGGAVFTHFALRHPHLVSRVIMVGSGGLGTPHGPINIGRLSGLEGEARRAMMRSNLLGLMLHHPETVDEMAMHLLVSNGRQARLPAAELVIPDKVLQILGDLTVPLDAIWGEFDRPHPDPAMQEAVLRRFQPAMDFRVIAGAGHWAMYERTEAFDQTLLAMLGQPPRVMEPAP